jgi:hypothetical protein
MHCGSQAVSYLPLIIVGAPRSGTNMLRNVMCGLPTFGTWPCDEINYIWRYDNPDWPTDALPVRLATDPVSRYIESRFSRLASVQNLQVVVEKTCANSLRVPYVNAVLPNARYIWIYRDPLDCVASALKRWSAPLDWMYTLRKARYVPLHDISSYALRFVRNRMHRLASGNGRLASWGPVFEAMGEYLTTRSLAEVCALQWQACVEQSFAAFSEMPAEKWTAVSYERFVSDPNGQLSALCDFLSLPIDSAARENAIRDVSAQSVGRGRRELGVDDAGRIDDLVASTVLAMRSLPDSPEA